MPPSEMLAYPLETAIAEKLQAMVALGSANSRMKDFLEYYRFRKLVEISVCEGRRVSRRCLNCG